MAIINFNRPVRPATVVARSNFLLPFESCLLNGFEVWLTDDVTGVCLFSVSLQLSAITRLVICFTVESFIYFGHLKQILQDAVIGAVNMDNG